MAADDVLRAIANAAKNVSGVDADAIARMLPVVDDWGWKGGKPGELTGGEYVDAYRAASKKADAAASRDELSAPWLNDYELDQIRERAFQNAISGPQAVVTKQLKKGSIPIDSDWPEENILRIMQDFADMERAGVPRAWTGKLFTPLREYSYTKVKTTPKAAAFIGESAIREVSDLMRPLTNDQRETFVSLLPEWDGSLEDLAEASKNL